MVCPAPHTHVSVDLDDLACYHAIHGLKRPDPALSGLVLERCLSRFLELFRSLDVRATFFVIGRDLERDIEAGGRGAGLLQEAIAEGHEVGNHSYSHAYDIVRWAHSEIENDLRRCDKLLCELGADVLGFRAPGYSHDDRMMMTAVKLGYHYDSSLLPSPAYYLAKAGVMSLMALRGRKSSSLLRGAGAFRGKAGVHRRKDASLWEIPMSVTPGLRLPLIGTTVLSGPERLQSVLMSKAANASWLHLELHGLDLADPDMDQTDPMLCSRQPELQTPLKVKRDRLRGLLKARGGASPLRDALPTGQAATRYDTGDA